MNRNLRLVFMLGSINKGSVYLAAFHVKFAICGNVKGATDLCDIRRI
jgi:uncharacterized membrane protein YuzA (DUF378 family)